MINTILTVIFYGFFLFLCFMVTPFGVYWNLDLKEKGKPAYGFLIVIYGCIPFIILGMVLGYIPDP